MTLLCISMRIKLIHQSLIHSLIHKKVNLFIHIFRKNNSSLQKIHFHNPCCFLLLVGVSPLLSSPATLTFTSLALYWFRLFALTVSGFFFSRASTLSVCPLTLPAQAREPCTLPPSYLSPNSTVNASSLKLWYCKNHPRDQSLLYEYKYKFIIIIVVNSAP